MVFMIGVTISARSILGLAPFVIIDFCLPGRYRLGVRTEDSQSSNPGSIPGSATNNLVGIHLDHLQRAARFLPCQCSP